MKQYQTIVSEAIFIGFTVSKRNWFCLSIYRRSHNNKGTIFEELTDFLSRAINNDGNIMLMGNFSITIKKENSITNKKLEEFCDTFN